MEDFSLQLQQVTQAILADYRLGRDIDKMELFQKPEADVVVQLLEKLRRILFPGYFREKNYRMYHVEANLSLLTEDVLYNLAKQLTRIYEGQGEEPEAAMCHAQEVGLAFLREIPRVRAMLQTDLQAAFDGDPAAGSMAEILFAYPGMFAVFVYRLAHVLYTLEVPMLPRMMTEHAHSLTGIDIHPGATIGEYFFIDHGTGVVIGETTVIGNRVKLYQGVTLGALSTRGGQKLRGKRRHPTIEDDVTIYAGASVLGGDTVIGQGSVIGSNVFITKSVPPCTTVTIKSQELHLRPAEKLPQKYYTAVRDISINGIKFGYIYSIDQFKKALGETDRIDTWDATDYGKGHTLHYGNDLTVRFNDDARDIEPGIITSGSLLESKTVDDRAMSQEDLEANAFAGLLLMPDNMLDEQIKMYGITGEMISVDDILTLMELFALPFKAVVLRLAENHNITAAKAQNLLKTDASFVSERMKLTGKALGWQQNSKELVHFGTLLDDMKNNRDKELLTDRREESDREYLEKIRKGFWNEY